MLSLHMGSLGAWLAKVSHIVPQWKKEGQTREDELRCSLPCRRTVSGHWGRDSVDGGWGWGVLWQKQKDDWFIGCLQCTEIIPLAAQLAWTWSMIPNVCLQTGRDCTQRWGGGVLGCRWVNKMKGTEIRGRGDFLMVVWRTLKETVQWPQDHLPLLFSEASLNALPPSLSADIMMSNRLDWS